ncbi:MAG: tetratricopeptide repeat protein [Burkholderiaceae bacterium]
MSNEATISAAKYYAVRYATPWRRLPWTGPLAILTWTLALWILPQFITHASHTSDQRPFIDTHIVELPPPPKPVPEPADVAAPTPANPQPKPQPMQHPQKHVEQLATALPLAEQAPATEGNSLPSPVSTQNVQQGSPEATGLPGNEAHGTPAHGINARAGAIGVIEHQHHFDSPAPGQFTPPDASIYNEEAVVVIDGLPPRYGLWHQQYAPPCNPLAPWDRSCNSPIHFQPTAPWCYDNDSTHPWNSTCKEAFNQAVAAYKRKDYATAFDRFKKLAEKEYSPAESNLAAMYAEGIGVEKDAQQAAFWWRKAAKENDPKAAYNLAMAYSDGNGVNKDDKEAVYWFRKAAYIGSNFAQYNLAVMYALGKGIQKDDTQAAFWYRQAAGLGNPDAAYNLGAMYEHGVSLPKGGREVVYWYCKATTRGSEEALERLASMYADGADKPNYHEVAYACWLVGLPTRSSATTAEIEREYIEKPLTQEQRTRAHVTARSWISRSWLSKRANE